MNGFVTNLTLSQSTFVVYHKREDGDSMEFARREPPAVYDDGYGHQSGLLSLALYLCGEFCGVNHKSFMDPFADKSTFVIGFDAEDESATVYLHQFAVAPYSHTNGCGGEVANVKVCANRSLALGEQGQNAVVASLFD